jgi:hypothetical protein
MELEGNWGFLFLLFFPLIGSEKKSKKTNKSCGFSLVPMRRIPMKSKPLSLIKNHSWTAAQSQEGKQGDFFFFAVFGIPHRNNAAGDAAWSPD